MRICFDLDETLCTGKPYTEAKPLMGAGNLLSYLKSQGHTIIIYTARGMNSCAGNAGQAVATIGEVTLQQLKEWGFCYDEVVFGKPAFDILVDDKSVSNIETLCKCLGLEMSESNEILEYRVGAIEKLVANEISKIADKLTSLDKHATDQRIFQVNFGTKFDELETRWEDIVERLEARIENLEDDQDEQNKEVFNLKLSLAQKIGPGAIAGFVMSVLVAAINAFWGK